jgi:hypothetical protein
LGLPHDQGPSIATVHRLFSKLDGAAFEQILKKWFKENGIEENFSEGFSLEMPGAKAQADEKLPGVAFISQIAYFLQAAANQNYNDPATNTLYRKFAELPILILAGKATTATALLAQRELMQQIQLQNANSGFVSLFENVKL